MIRSDQILKTVEMIQKENLDVRAVTMGISLLDCRTGDAVTTAQNIEEKIKRLAGSFVETFGVSSTLEDPAGNDLGWGGKPF